MEYLQALARCQPTWKVLVDRSRLQLADWFWPPVCILCRGRGQSGLDLCPACERELPRISHACSRCGAALLTESDAERLCGACLKRAPFFNRTYAPFRYAYPLDHVVQALKYDRQVACGRVLGALLASFLARRSPNELPSVVIPTPLSHERFRRRGFNQAYEIARPLRAALGVEIRADLVVRVRDTREQAGLKRKERRRNVRGAFVVQRPLPAAHVAILDDVVTTGSTANELAKVLRRAGAQKIEVWAVARTTDG